MPEKDGDNNLLRPKKPGHDEPNIFTRRAMNDDDTIKRSPYCPHNYPWGHCPKGCK
jgi:hypothetical protein